MNKRAKAAHRKLRKTKPKSWCLVYVLREFEGGPIYVVGQTRNSLEIRLSYYLTDIRRRNRLGKRLRPILRWFNGVLEKGKTPFIEAIDVNGIWDVSEIVWIDRLRSQGHPILNVQSVVESKEAPPVYAELWG
jgi:hypothetical protein